MKQLRKVNTSITHLFASTPTSSEPLGFDMQIYDARLHVSLVSKSNQAGSSLSDGIPEMDYAM
jgi:hypothetical protein